MKNGLYFIRQNWYTDCEVAECHKTQNINGAKSWTRSTKKYCPFWGKTLGSPSNILRHRCFYPRRLCRPASSGWSGGGIITGYRATVAPEKLGYHITAFINVVLPPERQQAFYEFVKQCASVVECYHVAGAYSMLLKVCFPDTQQLDAFVATIQKYGKTQTQIVFSSIIEHREPGVQEGE